MGKLIRFLYYQISFVVFSADINEKRRHIHAVCGTKNAKLCKFWIEKNGKNDTELVYNYGFSQKELTTIEKLINENYETINKQLDIFYNGKQVKSIKI
ncbi:MAG: hypothetical protein A3H98_00250 [Bacteroidetes bacterium RIFCSPLOWO2_02_FULL_36_8]|nr:MAG: hypothetical protein A3H98_00250 [Bacteroidetes bacterium RIFCSPLOWO2_02_FULL_36_8]OFY70835.1 MAG: hypothetical protein A3G23_11985 [Bacteroidetes bacterium RIFCSPLOWO2_12_FULL_37_12]